MKHISLFFPIILFSSFCFDGRAQTWDLAAKKQRASKSISKKQSAVKSWRDHLQKWGLDSNYNHALAIGGKLNTNGWSGQLYYEKKDSRSSEHFFQLSFSEIKHDKQIKQQKSNTAFPELGSASSYVFGKINNLYTLQLSYGKEYLLFPGILEGNMSISLRVQGGFSLAMLKPYYLKLIYITYDTAQHVSLKEEKYTEQNADKFLNTGNILGASSWSKGLSEISYVPGAFVDAAIALEPLKNKTFIKTVTLGGNFAFYSKNLPIMAETKAYPWQVSLFVGLSIGKRWQ